MSSIQKNAEFLLKYWYKDDLIPWSICLHLINLTSHCFVVLEIKLWIKNYPMKVRVSLGNLYTEWSFSYIDTQYQHVLHNLLRILKTCLKRLFFITSGSYEHNSCVKNDNNSGMFGKFRVILRIGVEPRTSDRKAVGSGDSYEGALGFFPITPEYLIKKWLFGC